MSEVAVAQGGAVAPSPSSAAPPVAIAVAVAPPAPVSRGARLNLRVVAMTATLTTAGALIGAVNGGLAPLRELSTFAASFFPTADADAKIASMGEQIQTLAKGATESSAKTAADLERTNRELAAVANKLDALAREVERHGVQVDKLNQVSRQVSERIAAVDMAIGMLRERGRR